MRAIETGPAHFAELAVMGAVSNQVTELPAQRARSMWRARVGILAGGIAALGLLMGSMLVLSAFIHPIGAATTSKGSARALSPATDDYSDFLFGGHAPVGAPSRTDRPVIAEPRAPRSSTTPPTGAPVAAPPVVSDPPPAGSSPPPDPVVQASSNDPDVSIDLVLVSLKLDLPLL